MINSKYFLNQEVFSMQEASLKKNPRNSSVELLRILAMFFIVISHSCVHGGFPDAGSAFALNDYILDWFSLGNLGVDIFVIISGYYLYTKEFNIRSVIKLLTQVWFFSYLCLALYLLAGNELTVKQILVAVLPTLFEEYWFFTAYFVLLLLSPFINLFIQNITRKQLLSCLSLLIVLWSVVPTFTTRPLYGKELAQFVLFYFMGAYLRKYPDNLLNVPSLRRIILICCVVLLPLSSATIRYLSAYLPPFSGEEHMFYKRSSVLIIGLAVSMVAAAVYRKPWVNPFINTLASCTFGIYLFHDNPLMRQVLWLDWLNNGAFYHSETLILRLAASTILVFALGAVLDFIRQKIFERPMTSLVQKLYWPLEKAAKKGYDLVFGILDAMKK